MEKTTHLKKNKRKYSNSNNKRMSKVLKIDFVLNGWNTVSSSIGYFKFWLLL